MATVNLNWRQLDAAISKAFRDVADEFAEANQDAIASPVFSHPNSTLRTGGGRVRLVGSPRDKVDSGALLESQQPPRFERRGNVFVIAWTAPYSFFQHEGYTTRSGRVIPAARWTLIAMQRYPLTQNFARKVRERTT